MKCTSIVLWVLMAGSVFAQDGESPGCHPARRAQTVDVRLLPLSGPLSDPRAEVSSLTWKDDTLVILPQFPEIFGQGDMLGFFTLPKDEILKRVHHGETAPLEPVRVDCQASGLMRIIRGFDGLEAIGIIDEWIYLTVEAKEDSVMAGYLVGGHYEMVEDQVVIEMARLTSIPMGVNIPNVAEESIVIDGQRVITFGEANGRNVIENPLAKVFDRDINYLGSIPFPSIEYRVTDATAQDAEGRFWILNYYYPGEEDKLNPASDPEVEKFGFPENWSEGQCVERLLELRLTEDDRIVRTETPPINLRLNPDGGCRNWEALVRLGGEGFLLMTDKYPGTLFGFAPNPYVN
jgi:hypothetical protein